MPAKTSESKKSAARRSAARKTVKTRRAASEKKTEQKKAGKVSKKWSANVMNHSNALDLESHIFESNDPKKNRTIIKALRGNK